MGQKSNPIGLRLQVNRTWDSSWFAEGQDYGRMLVEDLKIRQYVFKTLPQRSEEHTSELHSLMGISYAFFCLTNKNQHLHFYGKNSYYTLHQHITLISLELTN